MKAVCAIILVLALVLGANAYPKRKQINRSVLENRLRMFLKPGFRTELDDNLKAFIDTVVRDVIKNGNTDLGIPPADPLELAQVDINIDQENLLLEGFLENVVITGASSFKVENVQTDLTTLTAVIDISLDAARVVGDRYVMTGSLLNGALDVFGDGSFEVDLNQMTLNVRIVLHVKDDGFVEITVLELDVTVGSGLANFENLMGGGVLGEIANDFISSELPNLVETNKGPILEDLAATLKQLIKEKVGDITLDDLLNLINNPPPNA